jgi:uncharacterized protein involved in exopolysaccharide biosynthesis
MFDLDHEIAQWRQAMAVGGITDPAILDELESHLRDYVAQETRAGCDVELAFKAGLERIGQAGVLKREFLRANKNQLLAGVILVLDDRQKCLWSALALSGLVAVGFYCWHARITPVYESAARLQLLQRPSQSIGSPRLTEENDIRSAERLNAAVKLLSSGRMRIQVTESLTQGERTIVRRVTAMRHASNEPVPTDDELGALTVRPLRLAHVITVSVVHENAEAAAIVANRYADLCVKDLRNTREFPEMAARIVDWASPAQYPKSPNLLQALAAIALGTLISLLITAAALRKLAHMRMNIGPQVRTS